MMKRNKIILLVLLVIAVAACGGVGWLLAKSIMNKNAAEEKRNRDYDSLRKIYNGKVFPSPENIERVKADQKELETWLVEVNKDLHKGDLPDVKLTPATFKQKLQQTVRALKRQPGTKSNGKVVDTDFYFGFDQYLGESNELPERDNVPRLTTQLGMIEKISLELYSAKVLTLESIEREVFENTEKTEDEQPQGNRGSRRRTNKPQPNKPEPQQNTEAYRALVVPEELATKERFSVEFKATPEAYISALNKLSSMELFAVITESSFTKTGDQLQKLEDDAEKDSDETSKSKKDHGKSSHDERTVTDPRSDPPVRVKLVIDVYTFKGI